MVTSSGQLNEKIAKAMEHSADLNRLQNLCRQLQAEQDRHKRTPPTPVTPVADLSAARVRELERQVSDYEQLSQTMQSALTDAKRTAATCAQIAKVKDEQCQQLQSDLDAQQKRQKETTTKLFDVTERAQREQDKFDTEISAAKDRAREFQDMLKILKAAWTKREAEWLAYDADRNEKWKAEAAKWMSTASTKLDELKAGSVLLQEMTLHKGASGAS